MIESIIGGFSEFETDIRTAMSAIDDILFFKIDLDTTGADEQISALITNLEAYITTLNPESEAYTQARQTLDSLIQRFIAIGGSMHGGGLVTAHNGQFFDDETLALLQKDEMVLQRDTTRKFTQPSMNAFNITGDPTVLQSSNLQRQSTPDFNQNEGTIFVNITTSDEDFKIDAYDEFYNPRKLELERNFTDSGNPYE